MTILLALNAFAADHFVSDATALNAAINAAPGSGASSDHVIYLYPGDYTVDVGNQNNRRFELRALVPGSVVLTTSSGGVLDLTGNSEVVLDGLVIEPEANPALRLDTSGAVTVSRTRFQNAGATVGDPAYVRHRGNGTVTLDHARFDGGATSGKGGQVYANAGDLVITDSWFMGGTSSSDGGCVAHEGDQAIVSRSSFAGCSSGRHGGGIFLSTAQESSLDHSRLESNTAYDHGGNLATDTSLSIDHSVVCLGSSTTGSGGGLFFDWQQYESTTVSHTLFLNNGSVNGTYGGAAMRFQNDNNGNRERHVTVDDSSFVGNTAYGAHAAFLQIGWDGDSEVLFRRIRADYNGTSGELMYSWNYSPEAHLEDGRYWQSASTEYNFDSWQMVEQAPSYTQPSSTSCDPLDVQETSATIRGAFSAGGLVDADGDGFIAPEDCDDTNPAIRPGVSDGCNGIDDDCDGEIDENAPTSTHYVDQDGDGAAGSTEIQACGEVYPRVHAFNDDCDDTDPNTLGTSFSWHPDDDGDGYGDPNTPVSACSQPSGYVPDDNDCDDDDIAIFPGAQEVCDGADNDCDGSIDNDATDAATWYRDQDGDGYGNAGNTTQACSQPGGYVADATDCQDDGSDAPFRHPGRAEVCDNRDNDCNSVVDDNPTDATTWFADSDGDGAGDPNVTLTQCTAPGGYIADGSDCDDTTNARRPGLTEICDGLDNDCNNAVDDNASDASTWYRDADGDGESPSNASTVQQCTQPAGYVASLGNDCADTGAGAAQQFSGNPETCDGLDNDCNGTVDDGASDALTWYEDADGDGHSAPTSATALACDQPVGFVDSLGTDCDDTDPLQTPGRAELCDQVDNDCNGTVDDGITTVTYFPDGDGDGYGIQANSVDTCESLTTGYATEPGDCDDGDPTINPDADELCDGVDNDCDGDTDIDAIDQNIGYPDLDGDTWGDDSAAPLATCADLPADHVTRQGDCNDDPNADGALQNPDQVEVCDLVDNNCDGTNNEGFGSQDWFRDLDGDSYGDPLDTVNTCAGSPPAGYVANAGDCNDDPATDGSLQNPDQIEVCDGLDNDCNGEADEGLGGDFLFPDRDGDGHGDQDAEAVLTCLTEGYASTADDCDDNPSTGAAISPSEPEICDDQIDNDCDLDIDADDSECETVEPTDPPTPTDLPGDTGDTAIPGEIPVLPTMTDGGCGCASGSGGSLYGLFALPVLLFARRR